MVQIKSKYISLRTQPFLFVESYAVRSASLNSVYSQNPEWIRTKRGRASVKCSEKARAISHFATRAGGVRSIWNTPYHRREASPHLPNSPHLMGRAPFRHQGTYVLLTEQFEVVPLGRAAQPVLVQQLHLVDHMDVGSDPLHHLVSVHSELLHPANQNHPRTHV